MDLQSNRTDSTQPTSGRGAPWIGYVLGPIFLLVAAWFMWGPVQLNLPIQPPVMIDATRLTTDPRRIALGNPPVINIDGFDRTCMDCHRMFPTRSDPPVHLMQHQHIVLDHGINDRCRNCHDEKDRNRLVLHGGPSIAFDEVVRLCAKCHGPTYRDWQRGAHGRTNGYWDFQQGEVRRLTCTECHNPHNPRVPAMDPLAPLPGPHTLRMRVATHAGGGVDLGGGPSSHAADPRDPLRRRVHPDAMGSLPAESVPNVDAVEFDDDEFEEDEFEEDELE